MNDDASASQSFQHLLSDLRHDLKNPVGQIMGYAEMLDMPLSELIGEDAVIVSDKHQIRAVELMQDIGQDRRDLALKVLEALIL